MLVHVARRVQSTPLTYSRALLPLFEAIINSIHAIDDAKREKGTIDIYLGRDLSLLPPDPHPNYLPDVKHIKIVDDGVGFTPENLDAFKVVDTPHKIARGGKGLGRLTWLKAFERAEIESIYTEGDLTHRCSFSFLPTAEGVEDVHQEPTKPQASQTSVQLIDFKKEYREHCPKRADTIARRIVEHFFQNFILGTMPQIYLHDNDLGDSVVDLWDLYKTEYHPKALPRVIWIQDHPFKVQDVLLKDAADNEHSLHFCAAERPIKSVSLAGKIPHLDGKFEDEAGTACRYAAYITSPFLEKRVNGERTDFAIDHRDELRFDGGLSWEEIVEKITAHADSVLRDYTAAARERSLERTTRFISETAPEYRHLLKYAREELAKISASEDKLELSLHRIDADWRARLLEEGEKLLKRADHSTTLNSRKKQYEDFFERLTDSVKSDLAQYVVRRRMVLSFLEQQMGKQEDGRFPQEASLHSLIMPQRSRSNEIQEDEQNLWILDERLAYHLFLASDIPFQQHDGPIEIADESRPDILLYNRAMLFSEGEETVTSAIIVEFKRPERNEYREDDDPIQQVYDYIDRVRSGRARTENGRAIRIKDDLPFYCFVVADLTPKMTKFSRRASLIPSPDGDGYFGFNQEYRAYVEVVSYDKLLRDAKRRNRAFFNRLNMHMR